LHEAFVFVPQFSYRSDVICTLRTLLSTAAGRLVGMKRTCGSDTGVSPERVAQLAPPNFIRGRPQCGQACEEAEAASDPSLQYGQYNTRSG